MNTDPARRPPLPVRVGAVVAGALLIWLAMSWLNDHGYDRFPQAVRHAANAVTVFALAVPMVLAARRWLDRRTWSGLRLTGIAQGWWPLLVGAAAWLTPAGAGLALCLGLGWVEITVAASPVRLAGAAALVLALVLLFEAIPEELIFRGYLYRNLATAMAPWLAVIVQAGLFAGFGTALWVITNGWQVGADRLMIFLGFGLVLGSLRVLTGNVWAAVGYHLAFQVVAQLLLTAHYAEVEVQGERILTVVAFGGAFLLGAPVAALLLRLRGGSGRVDWRAPQPDPPPAPALRGAR